MPLAPAPVMPWPGRRALAALALAPLLLSHPAAAHALVLSSQPQAGARLAASPSTVALRFNSKIDHGRSRLTLIGPNNAQLPLVLAAEADPALVEAPLPQALAAGPWRLRWQVLAVDGHITRGDIFFTVAAR